MQYRLHLKNEHIFVEIDGALWLIDTGAPMSFGGTVQFGAHVKTLSTTAMGGLLGGQLSLPNILQRKRVLNVLVCLEMIFFVYTT